MQIARARPRRRFRRAIALAEHAHLHVVAAAADAKRVKRLVQIADEVHQKFQRRGSIGAIELPIRKPLFPV
ncbi:hypothetical protein D3C83_146930 [compost metagenome]